MNNLGKIVDTGTVPGLNTSDRFWKTEKKPMVIFNPTDKSIRHGLKINKAYLDQLNNPDKVPDFLIKTFNLNGFEFGNWTTQEDRVNYILGLSVALYDLQQILGFERHQIGLLGKLSIAFGSRGVAKASGHFEPNTFVINLSRHSRGLPFKELNTHFANGKAPRLLNKLNLKESDSIHYIRRSMYKRALLSRGLQTLVHEYGHALDYYFGTYIEKTSANCLSGGSESYKVAMEASLPIAQKMQKLLNAICFTDKGKPSSLIERTKKQGNKLSYYLSRNEIFARAFEKYINYKMKHNGWFNTYFSKFKDGEDGLNNKAVYLTDNEMKRVLPLFDDLVNEMRKGFDLEKGKKLSRRPSNDLLVKPDGVQVAAGVVMVDLKEIQIDRKRFQNREAAYNKESVNRIVDNFDSNKLDPVVLWHDANGEIYILSGHSRLEAHIQLKKNSIPARFFRGSEAQAIEFARVDANRSATSENLIEDIKAYTLLRDGDSKRSMKPASKEELKKRFSKWAKLEHFSYLNPKGLFIETLNSESKSQFPYIDNKATWTGQLKRQYPNLTNEHENEIFHFLFSKEGLNLNKEAFVNRVERSVNRIDFNSSQSLLLDKHGKKGTEARSDTAELQERIFELDSLIKLNKEQLKRVNTKPEKEFLTNAIQNLLSEKEKLGKDIKLMLESQQSLFGPVS